MEELVVALVGQDVYNQMSFDMKCVVAMFMFTVIIMIVTSMLGYIRFK